MIALLVISYILIGIIIGVVGFVFIINKEEEYEPAGIFIGILWPASIVVYLVYKILEFLIRNVYNVCTYIQDEGLHYCKEDLENCCGKCKYIQYCNNHNEINQCIKHQGIRISSEVIPCNHFKKYWLWRFKIRYKWDDNQKNK